MVMSDAKPTVQDPVCGMVVDPNQLQTHYLNMQFAFCSRQCQQRFVAHPHLYIGFPGTKAPKQDGRSMFKRRRLHLADSLSPEMAARVRQHLLAMMGVQNVEVDAERIEIVYDLLQATTEQIEAQLEQVGAQLGSGWGERLRRAFVHYLEDTEVDTMEARPEFHGYG